MGCRFSLVHSRAGAIRPAHIAIILSVVRYALCFLVAEISRRLEYVAAVRMTRGDQLQLLSVNASKVLLSTGPRVPKLVILVMVGETASQHAPPVDDV
jgi:hypothetical protein